MLAIDRSYLASPLHLPCISPASHKLAFIGLPWSCPAMVSKVTSKASEGERECSTVSETMAHSMSRRRSTWRR